MDKADKVKQEWLLTPVKAINAWNVGYSKAALYGETPKKLSAIKSVAQAQLAKDEARFKARLKEKDDEAVVNEILARKHGLDRPELRGEIEKVLYNPDNLQGIEYPTGSAPWSEEPTQLDMNKVMPQILALIPDEELIHKDERERIIYLIEELNMHLIVEGHPVLNYVEGWQALKGEGK